MRSAIVTQMPARGLITFLPCKHWSFGYVAGVPKLLGMKTLEQENEESGREMTRFKTFAWNSPRVHLRAESSKLRTQKLIHFLRPRNPPINRLSAREPFLGSMPVRDRLLPQLPAEQNNLTLNDAGKIKQSNVEIFHLHAN